MVKSLAKRPDKRYAVVRDLRQRLSCFLFCFHLGSLSKLGPLETILCNCLFDIKKDEELACNVASGGCLAKIGRMDPTQP